MAGPEKVCETIFSQIPVGRLREATEIACCVVFLASDDASLIAGATLTAKGADTRIPKSQILI